MLGTIRVTTVPSTTNSSGSETRRRNWPTETGARNGGRASRSRKESDRPVPVEVVECFLRAESGKINRGAAGSAGRFARNQARPCSKEDSMAGVTGAGIGDCCGVTGSGIGDLGNVGGSPTPGNHTAETGLAGWGARPGNGGIKRRRFRGRRWLYDNDRD